MAVLTGYARRDRGDFMGNYRIPPRRVDFSSDARGYSPRTLRSGSLATHRKGGDVARHMMTKIVGLLADDPRDLRNERSLCRNVLLIRSASWINKLEPGPGYFDHIAMRELRAVAIDRLAVDSGRRRSLDRFQSERCACFDDGCDLHAGTPDGGFRLGQSDQSAGIDTR